MDIREINVYILCLDNGVLEYGAISDLDPDLIINRDPKWSQLKTDGWVHLVRRSQAPSTIDKEEVFDVRKGKRRRSQDS